MDDLDGVFVERADAMAITQPEGTCTSTTANRLRPTA
jgi:hypothetical protein